MSVWKRIVRYLRGRIERKLDEVEDPGILIDQLVREMKENQVKNREQAVLAITQKNNLQTEVNRQERLAAEYEKKATIALQTGNRELARQILREKATVETTLGMLRNSLAVAVEAAEKVKIAIRAEEERIRQRMAEAQGMQARWNQARIQENIQTALGQFNLNDNQTSWEEVEKRIQERESRSLALGELQHISIEAKLDEIEMYQKDIGVEQELEELERRLALGGSPAPNYNTGNVQQTQTLGGGGFTR
jgi:phage shock protein A